MKKTILICFIALLAASSTSYAQTDKKNIFKVNVLSPIVRTGSFFYERVITEKSSAQLGFFYTGFSTGETRIRGFGITPEYRFYLSNSKEAPTGFYVGPYLRYQNIEFKVDGSISESARLTGFGGGLVLGGQWVFSDIIALDIFAGPNYNGRRLTYEGGATEDDFNFTGFGSFGLRLGVTLGVAF
jgi:Protein of unknown function (DUF3575)